MPAHNRFNSWSGSIPGWGRSPGDGIGYPLQYSLVAQLVKNPPAMRETCIQVLSWEDIWRRERQPTPIFWPGEFHSPWGRKESDMTEQLLLSQDWKLWDVVLNDFVMDFIEPWTCIQTYHYEEQIHLYLFKPLWLVFFICSLHITNITGAGEHPLEEG